MCEWYRRVYFFENGQHAYTITLTQPNAMQKDLTILYLLRIYLLFALCCAWSVPAVSHKHSPNVVASEATFGVLTLSYTESVKCIYSNSLRCWIHQINKYVM